MENTDKEPIQVKYVFVFVSQRGNGITSTMQLCLPNTHLKLL
jgi:hypothetical protein